MHGTDRTLRPDLYDPATGGVSFKAIQEYIAERETDLVESDPWLDEDNDDGSTTITVSFTVSLQDPAVAALVLEAIHDTLDGGSSPSTVLRSIAVGYTAENLDARIV